MIPTNKYDATFRRQLADALPKPDNFNKTAQIIGGNLDSAEEAYLKAIEGGDNQAIQKAEVNYQKAVRVHQTFTQLMKNSFQIMMEGIRGLSVR